MDWGTIIANWNTLWTIATLAIGQVAESAGFGEALSYFSTVIFAEMMDGLFLIMYPVIVAIGVMQNVIMEIFTPLINLFNALFSVGNTLMGMVTIFTGIFPSPWLVALTSIIGIQIGLRIYFFAKDIHILGFSV